MTRILVLLTFVFLATACAAQQMVVIKKGKIITRFNPGDEVRFVLKGDKQMYHVAILTIQEFSFVTLQKDTIQFNQIATLKFRNKGAWNYVKSTLIGAAGLTALSFALKPAYGDSNPNAIKGLQFAAGTGVVSSLFVLVMSKSHIKLNGFKRLKYVGYDSPLYR